MSAIMLERSGIVKNNFQPIELENYRRIPLLRKPNKQGVKPTVTIAMGFSCQDGMVICSDSEITYEGWVKTREPKIKRQLVLHGQAFTNVAITGAGWWDYVKMAMEKILSGISKKQEPHDWDIQEFKHLVEEVVIDIYERNIAACPFDPKPSFSLLIGGWVGSSLSFLKSEHTAVTAFSDFECIGSGAVLLKYLADVLYDGNILLRQGYLLASYLLRAAKRYVPGCGGDSQIVAFHESGYMICSPGSVERYATPDEIEPYFREFDDLLRPLLTSFPDVAQLDTEFEQSVSKFCDQLRELRERVKRLPLPDSIYLP